MYRRWDQDDVSGFSLPPIKTVLHITEKLLSIAKKLQTNKNQTRIFNFTPNTYLALTNLLLAIVKSYGIKIADR
jgi:hypothetical protein